MNQKTATTELTTFRAIAWGEDDARKDVNLAKYFVGRQIWEPVVLGQRRYIVGRKGTGKTALIERIRIGARDEYASTWHVSDLSLRSFPLQLLRDLRDKSYRDKSQFVPAWTFIIAVELARLVVNDPAAASSAQQRALREFLRQNFNAGMQGFVDTTQQLHEKNGQVVIPSVGTAGAKSSEQQTTARNYWETTRFLLDCLRDIGTKSSYYVLVDDLDEGFRAGDPSLRLLLLALLRAVEDVHSSLQSAAPHYRLVVALRDDIFDSLEDADLNKLDDYVVRLRWTSDPDHLGRDEVLSLRDLVGARIRASRTSIAARDAWPAVVLDDDPRRPRGVASLWAYVLNRTYERPRDLIKFMKLCDRVAPVSGKLSFSHLLRAEVEYSDWLYRELRDEIQSFLPVWKEAFQAISQISCGIVGTRELRRQLEVHPDIAAWLRSQAKSPDDIISLLFDYGVVGSYTSKRVWSFRYKDTSLIWNPRAQNVIVHWGLVRKLRLERKLASEDVAPWRAAQQLPEAEKGR